LLSHLHFVLNRYYPIAFNLLAFLQLIIENEMLRKVFGPSERAKMMIKIT
jgi:hypothetical protein